MTPPAGLNATASYRLHIPFSPSGSTGGLRRKGYAGCSGDSQPVAVDADHYPLTADDSSAPAVLTSQYGEFFWPFHRRGETGMFVGSAPRAPLAFCLLRNTASRPLILCRRCWRLAPARSRQRRWKSCASLKRAFLCSGEALPTALCREWETLNVPAAVNLYGPTGGGRGGCELVSGFRGDELAC
ncbi:hypothetical protein KCP73_04555 [Salmonella enterica subsp. enterica]|nr:hypothetical protein KCP73_04555 [Salmonella enterica subsp. enterica]